MEPPQALLLPPADQALGMRGASMESSPERTRTMSDLSGTSSNSMPVGQDPTTSLADPESPHMAVRGSVRRAQPQMNASNQYICDASPECAKLVFQRKCEWSKHMDRHDRPYRCKDPVCAKLQGFTYSGGLLRHEREVHNKHGGPKERLRCPYADCKRHDGNGFTRKENLNEHIRRVHEKRRMESKPGSPQSQSSKRRWSDATSPEPLEDDSDLLRRELKRLQGVNHQLQSRMDGMEEEMESLRRVGGGNSMTSMGFRHV